MSIYRISTNIDNMMFFHITQEELEAKSGVDPEYHAGSQPKPQTGWQKVNAAFVLPIDYKESMPVPLLPDVTNWGQNHLVFNQKAYDVVSEHLKPFGEFLPVICEGNNYYLFNILQIANDRLIDQANSEKNMMTMDGMTMQMGIKKLKFKEDKLKNTLIFKTDFDEYVGIFCNNSFKKLIEGAELKGIEFKEDLSDVF